MEQHLKTQNETLRQKVWYIINTIQANQLFVHSAILEVKFPIEEQSTLEKNPMEGIGKRTRAKKTAHNKVITKNLPEILTICILNALTPNSAMLLIGGHGGGKTSIVKYLARMFTGISLSEAEECILRSHPQLTEEKVIASLNFPKLMKEGKEEVNWRKFATCFWKIIDEVNRTSPYTQNILLSLLAEGKIKYYDAVIDVSKYCLYATLNPNDAGTFELSPPFLDRFGISVPISMPKSQDLAIILGSHDEKLGGYDELIQVPAVLTEDQLLSIWYEIGAIPCSQEAKDYIHAIVREYTLCIRVDKGNSEFLKPSTGLCVGCHYNIPDKIPCSNVDSILSVRVAKDLLRYAKALTWLLGATEVSVPMVEAVAPYVISHRAVYIERILNADPYWGSKIEFTKKMIEMIHKRFTIRQKPYEIIEKFRKGISSDEDLAYLRETSKNDLIVALDLLPLAEILIDSRYQKTVQEILTADQEQNVEKISAIRKELLESIDFPNRGELITRLNDILKKLTATSYNCTFEVWDMIRFTISGLFPEFSKALKETTLMRKTYLMRTEDLYLEVNVTGIQPKNAVNFYFYGGDSAKKLKDAINERHSTSLKSMEDILAEAEKAKETDLFKDDTIPINTTKRKSADEKILDDLTDSDDDLFSVDNN
jgi:MoxR-like ATPase